MNYCEWAAEYRENAGRVRRVIEKKKALLNDKKLTKDERKSISDAINAYRAIYRELLKTADHLSQRGERYHEA
ncbi:MAG: hypothetical protein IJH07_03285 [Ruminococcus sp.]|nr:hypothetical protein [Ruminococcus sp.]